MNLLVRSSCLKLGEDLRLILRRCIRGQAKMSTFGFCNVIFQLVHCTQMLWAYCSWSIPGQQPSLLTMTNFSDKLLIQIYAVYDTFMMWFQSFHDQTHWMCKLDLNVVCKHHVSVVLIIVNVCLWNCYCAPPFEFVALHHLIVFTFHHPSLDILATLSCVCILGLISRLSKL